VKLERETAESIEELKKRFITLGNTRLG